MSSEQNNLSFSQDTTHDLLTHDTAALLAEVTRLRQQVATLTDEKADFEMLLEMTTQHSDNMEEELYDKVEATLRESEKRFRLIVETMPIPVIISRLADNTIVYINEPASTLFGLPPEEVLGRRETDFYANLNDYQQVMDILSRDGKVTNYEMEGRAIDGTPFWIITSIQPMTYGEEACILNAFYDISERKRAEQERIRLTTNLAASLEQQVQLTTAYSRFVPREILKFLNKETIIDLRLGEHIQQQMTVLFSDIRDFTSLSEQMTPQENFNFINSYLSRVSPVIRKNRGYIDKYIGDAIMALFPGKNFPGQADDAIEAAIEMHNEVMHYNEYRARNGYSPISIGVGLHTGSVMLGTVGEEERMEGTVISDAVNLASRLEGLTKTYGAAIVVSERTLFSLERVMKYGFRFLDKVRVKGRRSPVSVFEIFADTTPGSVEMKLKTQTDFEKGLLHYHSEEFREASEYFERVLRVSADDLAAQLYLKRAMNFINYGVPVDWEGVSALTEK
jgi:PAS domain S-box-containing protein